MTVKLNSNQDWAEVERRAKRFERQGQIPHGLGPKLYLYWDLVNTMAWAKDPAEFRMLTGVTHSAIRCAHASIRMPSGYVRYGTLANDPIIRIYNEMP